MTIKQKAIQGVVWSVIQQWGSQAGSLLVFFVLARLLTPADFGLVAMANVFMALMQTFLEQGFAQALIQRQELEPAHKDTAFWISVVTGVLLLGLTLVGAGFAATLFGQPQLTPILQCLSLIFVVNSLGGTQQALLERAFNFRAIALRWLLSITLGGIVGISLALAGWGVWSLVGQQLAQEIVGVTILWVSSPWRPGWRFSTRHFHDLFRFGINVLAFNLLSFINTRADDLLIGFFLGPVALGYYSIAYRVLGVMTNLLINSSSQVALPSFSRLQTEPEQLRKAFYLATQLTSLIAFPAFLGVAVLAPDLVILLFGPQWLAVIPVMQVLSLIGIVRSVTWFKGAMFMALGKPSWRLWLGLLNAGLNLVGFMIAVRWGILAVAWAYVLRGYLVFPVGQWLISRLIALSWLTYLRQFVAPLLGSLLMALTLLGVRQWLNPWASVPVALLVYSVVGVGVYITLIRLLSPDLFLKLMEFCHIALTRNRQRKAL